MKTIRVASAACVKAFSHDPWLEHRVWQELTFADANLLSQGLLYPIGQSSPCIGMFPTVGRQQGFFSVQSYTKVQL